MLILKFGKVIIFVYPNYKIYKIVSKDNNEFYNALEERISLFNNKQIGLKKLLEFD